jgi:hypothetical protein
VRGCLSVLVLAIAFVSVGVWFGGPPLASAIVASTLTGSGFASDTLDVSVTGDPPVTLALGRANRITIEATGVRWHDLRMATLSLDLGTVDLITRTMATAEGRLGGAQLTGADGQPILADAELSGPADAAQTTITVDAAAVKTMARAAFESKFGIRPSSVSLVGPDVIEIGLAGMTVSSHLAIDADGSIVASANGTTVRILAPEPSLPLRLASLSVGPDALVLHGTLDVGALLR